MLFSYSNGDSASFFDNSGNRQFWIILKPLLYQPIRQELFSHVVIGASCFRELGPHQIPKVIDISRQLRGTEVFKLPIWPEVRCIRAVEIGIDVIEQHPTFDQRCEKGLKVAGYRPRDVSDIAALCREGVDRRCDAELSPVFHHLAGIKQLQALGQAPDLSSMIVAAKALRMPYGFRQIIGERFPLALVVISIEVEPNLAMDMGASGKAVYPVTYRVSIDCFGEIVEAMYQPAHDGEETFGRGFVAGRDQRHAPGDLVIVAAPVGGADLAESVALDRFGEAVGGDLGADLLAVDRLHRPIMPQRVCSFNVPDRINRAATADTA